MSPQGMQIHLHRKETKNLVKSGCSFLSQPKATK